MENEQETKFSLSELIIYQNHDFLVINKPNNLSVQENKTYPESLEKILKEQMNFLDSLQRVGIVHRLDRQTTGLILVAKNQKTLDYLSSLFKERKIHKTYLALIQGNLTNQSGEITFYLEKQFLSSGKIQMKINSYQGKLVQIGFQVLESLKEFSFLAIFPRTGRTHQIRLAFQKITCPIYNDPLYSSNIHNLLVGQYLHAYSLEFQGQKGEKFSFYAPLPTFFKEKLRLLESQTFSKYL